jgi:hypothetical protein
VTVESASQQLATLRVSDRRPAYELLDAHGKVLSRVPARAAVTHRIELRRVGAAGEWRIAGVSS